MFHFVYVKYEYVENIVLPIETQVYSLFSPS